MEGKIQIGKNGINDNFILSLNNLFKNHSSVRISVLKNATRDKETLKEYLNKILEGMGKNYTAKVIGFTIVLKKWRKEVR